MLTMSVFVCSHTTFKTIFTNHKFNSYQYAYHFCIFKEVITKTERNNKHTSTLYNIMIYQNIIKII